MTDPVKTSAPPPHANAGHETTDVRPGIIGLFGLGLVGMVALVLPFLGWVYWTLQTSAQRDQRAVSSLQPVETFKGPRLQAQPAVELTKVKREAMTQLTSYGWIDREKGIVHIPIKSAIEILAARGLPAPENTSPGSPPQEAKP